MHLIDYWFTCRSGGGKAVTGTCVTFSLPLINVDGENVFSNLCGIRFFYCVHVNNYIIAQQIFDRSKSQLHYISLGKASLMTSGILSLSLFLSLSIPCVFNAQSLMEVGTMSLCNTVVRERLTSAFGTVVERAQDFTDSAYTSHGDRERIVMLCDRLRLQLNQLLRIAVCLVSLS